MAGDERGAGLGPAPPAMLLDTLGLSSTSSAEVLCALPGLRRLPGCAGRRLLWRRLTTRMDDDPPPGSAGLLPALAKNTSLLPRCCNQLSAICLACQANQTVDEYCAQRRCPQEGCEAAPQLSASCLGDGVLLSGLPLAGSEPSAASSAGACQQRCADAAGCARFSYLKGNGSCLLFDGETAWEPAEAISGPRQCIAALQIHLRGLLHDRLTHDQMRSLEDRLVLELSSLVALPDSSILDATGQPRKVSVGPGCSPNSTVFRAFARLPAGYVLADVDSKATGERLKRKAIESLEAAGAQVAVVADGGMEDLEVSSLIGSPAAAQCLLLGVSFSPSMDSFEMPWGTLRLCRARCAGTQGCAHFTYFPGDHQCALHDAASAPSADAQAIAGPPGACRAAPPFPEPEAGAMDAGPSGVLGVPSKEILMCLGAVILLVLTLLAYLYRKRLGHLGGTGDSRDYVAVCTEEHEDEDDHWWFGDICSSCCRGADSGGSRGSSPSASPRRKGDKKDKNNKAKKKRGGSPSSRTSSKPPASPKSESAKKEDENHEREKRRGNSPLSARASKPEQDARRGGSPRDARGDSLGDRSPARESPSRSGAGAPRALHTVGFDSSTTASRDRKYPSDPQVRARVEQSAKKATTDKDARRAMTGKARRISEYIDLKPRLHGVVFGVSEDKTHAIIECKESKVVFESDVLASDEELRKACIDLQHAKGLKLSFALRLHHGHPFAVDIRRGQEQSFGIRHSKFNDYNKRGFDWNPAGFITRVTEEEHNAAADAQMDKEYVGWLITHVDDQEVLQEKWLEDDRRYLAVDLKAKTERRADDDDEVWELRLQNWLDVGRCVVIEDKSVEDKSGQLSSWTVLPRADGKYLQHDVDVNIRRYGGTVRRDASHSRDSPRNAQGEIVGIPGREATFSVMEDTTVGKRFLFVKFGGKSNSTHAHESQSRPRGKIVGILGREATFFVELRARREDSLKLLDDFKQQTGIELNRAGFIVNVAEDGLPQGGKKTPAARAGMTSQFIGWLVTHVDGERVDWCDIVRQVDDRSKQLNALEKALKNAWNDRRRDEIELRLLENWPAVGKKLLLTSVGKLKMDRECMIVRATKIGMHTKLEVQPSKVCYPQVESERFQISRRPRPWVIWATSERVVGILGEEYHAEVHHEAGEKIVVKGAGVVNFPSGVIVAPENETLGQPWLRGWRVTHKDGETVATRGVMEELRRPQLGERVRLETGWWFIGRRLFVEKDGAERACTVVSVTTKAHSFQLCPKVVSVAQEDGKQKVEAEKAIKVVAEKAIRIREEVLREGADDARGRELGRREHLIYPNDKCIRQICDEVFIDGKYLTCRSHEELKHLPERIGEELRHRGLEPCRYSPDRARSWVVRSEKKRKGEDPSQADNRTPTYGFPEEQMRSIMEEIKRQSEYSEWEELVLEFNIWFQEGPRHRGVPEGPREQRADLGHGRAQQASAFTVETLRSDWLSPRRGLDVESTVGSTIFSMPPRLLHPHDRPISGEEMFELIDANHDGSISQDEWRRGMRHLGFLPQSELSALSTSLRARGP